MFSVHPVYSVNAVCVFHRFFLYLGSAVLIDGQESIDFKPQNVKNKKLKIKQSWFFPRKVFFCTYLKVDAIFISVLTSNVLQTFAGLLCA